MKLGIDTGVLIAYMKSKAEKFHEASFALGSRLPQGNHRVIWSALVIEEIRGALAAGTKMPAEKIYESELTLQAIFTPEILPYEDYIERTRQVLLEFRELKRDRRVPAADFHHIATAIQEGCDLFVTIGERHFLAQESRDAFSQYIRIADPSEALQNISNVRH